VSFDSSSMKISRGYEMGVSFSDIVTTQYGVGIRTLLMNFLHVTRISLARVALNIMTCLLWGVTRKIS